MTAPRKDTLGCPECGSRFTDGRAHCSFDGTKLLAGGPDPLIGKKLDHYEVLERIGSGGMAAVYRVRHALLQQDYALKMLSGELASNPLVVRRFLREARAAAKIEHPNVVKVVYSGATERGAAFLVMELIPGRSLDTLISEYAALGQPVPPLRAAAIARQIALGLSEIHRAGFVHRDIKPSNIMLVPHGDSELVKILDLGVVGVMEPNESNPRVTKADHIVGTPQYMAPEALSGDPYHASADLYALGVVLYEMLSGRPIFEGTIPEIFWAQLNVEPEPLPRLDGFDELAHQLLAKQAPARPQSAEAVVRAIDHLLARGKVRGAVEDAPSRARRWIARAMRVSKTPRRLRWTMVAAAAVFLVLVADGVRFRANRSSTDALPVIETVEAAPVPSDRKPAPATADPQPTATIDVPPAAAAVERVEPRKTPPRRAARAKKQPMVQPAETVEVTIHSSPAGAAVIMNGGRLGLTPLTVALERDRPIALIFRLEGHTDRKITLRPNPNTPMLDVELIAAGAQ